MKLLKEELYTDIWDSPQNHVYGQVALCVRNCVSFQIWDKVWLRVDDSIWDRLEE